MLSDEEMRLLEQMERALVEEDPKFASTLRGTRFARATRARIVIAAVVFAGGVVAMMTGAIMGSKLGTVIAIAGFVLMLGSATIGLSAWKGRRAGPESSTKVPDSPQGLSLIQGGRVPRRPRRQKAASSGGTFMQRLEERWQRRRGQNGF